MIALLALLSTLVLQEAAGADLPPHAVARLSAPAVLQGGMRCVDVSPDGRRIATGGYDLVLLRDAVSGRMLKSLGPHRAGVQSVRFSPDGASLLTAASDGAVRLWDLAGGTLLRTFSGASSPGFLNASFSSDGLTVLSCTHRGELFAWETATGKELLRRSIDAKRITGSAVSPTGSTAAFVEDKAIHVVETTQGTETAVLRIADGLPRSIAFSADGTRLAVAGRTVQVWDLAVGTSLLRLHVGTWDSFALAFSRDGKRIAAGDQEGLVRVWEIDGPQRVVQYKGHTTAVTGLAFSPDGSVLLSVSSDRHLRITSVADGRERADGRAAPVRHTAAITALAVSPNGTMLVSADRRAVIRWSLPGGAARGPATPFDGDVTDLAFWPDGSKFGVAIRDTTGRASRVAVRSAASGDSLVELTGAGPLRSLAVSPDGKQVVAGTDSSSVRLWEQDVLAEKPPAGLGAYPLSLAFAPDGATLAGGDAILSLWDVRTGTTRALDRVHQRPILSIGFTADSRVVMSGSDGELCLWDAAAGKLLRTVPVADARTAALAPDGRWIAVGGADGVRLFEASSGKELLKMTGHESGVRRVIFLPDSRHLVSGGEDGGLLLWKPRP